VPDHFDVRRIRWSAVKKIGHASASGLHFSNWFYLSTPVLFLQAPLAGKKSRLRYNNRMDEIQHDLFISHARKDGRPYAERLSILVREEKGIRFIHLLLRDFFTYKWAIRELLHVDSHVRARAAVALGKLKDVRAVEPLIEALSDSNESVRTSVAEALGELGDERAIEPLIAAFADGIEVRFYAAEALRLIGTPEALAAVEAWEKRERGEDT
jgi:hypothetical protein